MGEAPKNLKAIIEALPNKVGNVLDHMRDLIQKLIEKGLLDFSYVHNLLYEYVVELHNYEKFNKVEELAFLLSDSLPKLITTKAGTVNSDDVLLFLLLLRLLCVFLFVILLLQLILLFLLLLILLLLLL